MKGVGPEDGPAAVVTPPPDNDTRRRRAMYALLIAIGLAGLFGRIAAVASGDGRTPFLSANDRSRWATIRTLVEDGTYEIDTAIADRGWDSIDKVRHAGGDGQPHYYSSKPPLLPTMLAGEYWLIKQATGRKLSEHPLYIGRMMLAITNGFFFLLFLWAVAGMAERCGTSDWGRIFVVAAACFGTFISTFAISLNNHLPAAACAAVSMLAVVAVWRDEERRWYWFVLAGFAAPFTVVNELPALGFLLMVAGALFIKAWRYSLLFFVPPVLLVIAAFFGTTWLAHQSLRPPYAHRGHGEQVATLEGDFAEQFNAGDAAPLVAGLTQAQVTLPEGATIEPRGLGVNRVVESEYDNTGDTSGSPPTAEPTTSPAPPAEEQETQWIVRDPNTLAIFLVKALGEGKFGVYQWDHWYDYPGSHWREENVAGLDVGEKSRQVYALHVLVGHHGIFSLTPLWLLSLIGGAMALISGKYRLRALVLGIAALTAVCLAFYLSMKINDRNYGGSTSCFRWMLWFAPLWLLCMLPIADWLAKSRIGRGVAILLLIASVASATVTMMNPWVHPWLYTYLQTLGWVG